MGCSLLSISARNNAQNLWLFALLKPSANNGCLLWFNHFWMAHNQSTKKYSIREIHAGFGQTSHNEKLGYFLQAFKLLERHILLMFHCSNNNNLIVFFTSHNQFMYNVKNVAQETDDPWLTMAQVKFRLYRGELTTPFSSCGNLASAHKSAISRPGIEPGTCDVTVRRTSQ